MLAAVQCFFDDFDTFDGTFAPLSQCGAVERHAQFLQALVVTAGDRAQTVALSLSLRRLRVLLHELVPRSGCMVHFIVYANNVYADNVHADN
jgi:hypothetical protein